MNPHQILVHEAASQFPATFGLRAFPGLTFNVNTSQSYVIDSSRGPEVMLYVFTEKGLDFCKSTPEALKREVVKAPH